MLAMSGDLATDPLLAHWLDNGWPLVARRFIPGELPGVPLGLPLPPCGRRRRLAFLAQPEDVTSIAAPPTLAAVSLRAPRSWWLSLDRLDAMAVRHAVDLRVCGSLAWYSMTGLDYVTARSDLDLLVQIHPGSDVLGVTAALAAIEATAPMRIDGEIIRPDGAAVSWRELHNGEPEILLKTVAGVALIGRHHFIEETFSW